MKKWIFVAAILMALVGRTFADECEELKEGSTASQACFLSKDYRRRDKMLNEIYADLLEAIDKQSYPREMLVNAQRAWLKFRDQQCELENVVFGGIESISWANCMSEMTGSRLAKLNELLDTVGTNGP